MKQKVAVLVGCMASILAISLVIVEEKQEQEIERTLHALKEENMLLTSYEKEPGNYESEMDRTERKIESDLRIETKRLFQEDMIVHVDIKGDASNGFQAIVGVGTNLPRDFHAELTDLIETTVSMTDVRVHIVEKIHPND